MENKKKEKTKIDIILPNYNSSQFIIRTKFGPSRRMTPQDQQQYKSQATQCQSSGVVSLPCNRSMPHAKQAGRDDQSGWPSGPSAGLCAGRMYSLS